MEDKITLMVNIAGEYAPRVYAMTGGDFDTMLAAVKALPERSFDRTNIRWQIRLAGIKTLKDAGFEVKKESDFFVFPPSSTHDVISGDEMHVSVGIAIRLPNGTTPMLPQAHASVIVKMSSECIALILEKQAAMARKFDMPVVTDKYVAYRVIMKMVTDQYGERLRAQFKAHYGKRTADDIKAAKAAVRQLIKDDEGLDETGHVHLMTYEAIIVDGEPAVRPVEKES